MSLNSVQLGTGVSKPLRLLTFLPGDGAERIQQQAAVNSSFNGLADGLRDVVGRSALVPDVKRHQDVFKQRASLKKQEAPD